ncbi:hypothetical protein CLOP_g19304 [Closterium sp. NIES-67]|nr:hypothetical protein CLOP_g19304 [Closterium sp. NIES-67]
METDAGAAPVAAAAGAAAAAAAAAPAGAPSSAGTAEWDSREAFLDIVADWLLLAGCNTHVLSQSGYSATAAFYSLRPFAAFMPDKCVPEAPMHADLLGRLRSGV